MRRRHFLAAALAALSPGWMGDALAADPPTAKAALAAAWARAQADKRPLLVIVADPDHVWDRQTAWGTVLTHGDDATMARFGQCEVVCARPETVSEVLGLHGVPWLWVVPPTGPARAVSGVFVATPAQPRVREAGPEREKEDAALAWRRATLGPVAALEEALAEARPCAPGAVLERVRNTVELVRYAAEDFAIAELTIPMLRESADELRATCADAPPPSFTRLTTVTADAERALIAAQEQVTRAGLTAGEAARLGQRVEEAVEVDALLAGMAHLVGATVGKVLGPVRRRQASALVERGISLYRKAPPANARWGSSWGCGTTYETALPDDRTTSFLCGMGHVPERTSRFLAFLVKT